MHQREPAARSIRVMGEYQLTAQTPGPQQVSGVADYVLGYQPAVFTVPPVYESFSVVVEAKKMSVGLGLGQAVAYMVAAQQHRMSLNPERTVNIVYGMVSDGVMWQFLRLDDKKLLLSDCFNTLSDPGRSQAYLFIDRIIRAGIELSPHTSPQKMFPVSSTATVRASRN
jgi:hypothetical protein